MSLLRPPLLLTPLVAALLALPAAAQSVGIHWQSDIETAKKMARDSNRLVLIHFWTESCGPCKMLEQNVFNQQGVGTAIESQFVPVKLNADQNSATAAGFGITRVPTDIIITPDGEVVGRLISPPTPSAYVAELSQISTQHSARFGQAFAQAAATAPVQSFNPTVNPAYASLPVNTAAAPAAPAAAPPAAASINNRYVPQPPTAAPQAPNANVAAATGSPAGYAVPPSATINRYAASAPPTPIVPAEVSPVAPQQLAAPPLATPQSPPQLAPPAITSRYVGATAAESVVPPSVPVPNQFANPYTPAPVPQAPAMAPAASGAPLNAAVPAATSPAAAQAAAAESRRLPPGAPPLGFDGYCPVSMRNQWKWVAGDPQFGIIHRERTYWFAGAEEQKQFWQNPDHYSPALSGLDPVLAVDHKQQVPGKREHSLDYDNLFYLFSSEATLQQFAANPERYASGVRQAMGIARGRMVR